MTILWFYLVVINVVALMAYGIDKWQAKKGGWRISERQLLVLVIVGGGLGAWCGRQWFRHKTRKTSFVVSYWIIIAAQAGLLIWWGIQSGT